MDSMMWRRLILAVLVFQQIGSAAIGIGYLLLLTLLRQLLRSTWAALGALMVIISLPDALMGIAPAWMVLVAVFVVNCIAGLVFVRHGLLAGVVTLYVHGVLMSLPMTMDLSSWTATPTFWVEGVVVALAVYGFRTALAGQPAFHSSPDA
jgi:hypothetical protein